jgi:hypothetical protein
VTTAECPAEPPDPDGEGPPDSTPVTVFRLASPIARGTLFRDAVAAEAFEEVSTICGLVPRNVVPSLTDMDGELRAVTELAPRQILTTEHFVDTGT